jgi:dsDNA-specific endonuclease/ATPase MutS2
MLQFKIGDKVSFLNEKGSGVITNIVTNFRVLVLNENGFEISCSTDEIVALAKKSDYKMDSAMSAKWHDQKEQQDVKPPKLENDEAWEVDLHLHELIDAYQQKGDHEKLLFQLNYFKKCMDAAILNRIKKVIFIHGVGKGTLKQGILHLLRDYERIRHFDAPFRKYGYGALIVEIL